MDQSYAPRSPNLAGYAPRSPDLAAYRPTTPAGQDLYAPRSPDLSGLDQLQQQQQHHPYPQHLAGPSSFGLDQHLPLQEDQLQQDHFQQDQLQQQQQQQWSQDSYPSQSLTFPHPQQPDLYQQHFAYQPQQPIYPQQYQQYPDMPVQTRSRGVRAPGEVGSLNDNNFKEFKEEPEWEPQPAAPTPARRGRKPKSESNNGASAASTSVMPAMKKMDTGGIEVKTKFPTARIKRIMQADEDVGKVAQVTPVVMAKALELFMIRLISASAGVAKQRGSKRVLSQHMKTAVMQDEQFDNLRDIVGKVPDAPSKGANVDNSDDEEGAPKKASGRGRKAGAGAGPGRGKKRRDSDDF